MEIKVNIPDESAQAVAEAFAAATGWTAASPVTQAEWIAVKTAAFVKDTVKRGLLIQAQAATSAAVEGFGIS